MFFLKKLNSLKRNFLILISVTIYLLAMLLVVDYMNLFLIKANPFVNESFVNKINVVYFFKKDDNGDGELDRVSLNRSEGKTVAEVSSTRTRTTTTVVNETNSSNDLCNLIPPNLNTRISINSSTINGTFESIERYLTGEKGLNLTSGGKSWPRTCKARSRVAVVVPYRSRENDLKQFAQHMHLFLNKQQLDYGLYVIEPEANLTFNRGLLMNIGFNESLRDEPAWECFVFHDVDLLPEDERNLYTCPETPRHMSSAVSTLNYQLPYSTIFGGVTEFKKIQFQTINGFSNLYFGWGGEDDDLRARVDNKNYTVSRYPLEIGRYTMTKHGREDKNQPNPNRFKLLQSTKQRMTIDGLNSLKYNVLKIERTKLFTKVYVSYNDTVIK